MLIGKGARCCMVLLFSLGFLAACRPQTAVLRLATTTTTVDSGLMAQIVPDFEQQFGVQVQIVAVGTGEALALGEAGDVDIVLVHARTREDEFVAAGFGSERHDVMVNQFVLLGPASDPANVQGMTDVIAAVSQIFHTQSPFISRGDQSGTHLRELALWAEAGLAPAGDWYRAVGQGMGSALTIAAEQQAYILSDQGTYIKRAAAGLPLQIMVTDDERLLNPYGIITVNPTRHPDVQTDLAGQFVDWITSPATQAAINSYQINGQQLFWGNAGQP